LRASTETWFGSGFAISPKYGPCDGSDTHLIFTPQSVTGGSCSAPVPWPIPVPSASHSSPRCRNLRTTVTPFLVLFLDN
jgi:hypothetical protein